MYAQKLEGESWIGERMDKGKIDKMSGVQQIYRGEGMRGNANWEFQINNWGNCMSSCKPFERSNQMRVVKTQGGPNSCRAINNQTCTI